MSTPDDTREPPEDVAARVLARLAYPPEAGLDGWMEPPLVLDIESWRDLWRRRAAAVLAALRDSGWVDPAEAARREAIVQIERESVAASVRSLTDELLRTAGELEKAQHEAGANAYLHQQVTAERDALLPVVEAAGAWRKVCGMDDPFLIGDARTTHQRLAAAVDAWESREEAGHGA